MRWAYRWVSLLVVVVCSTAAELNFDPWNYWRGEISNDDSVRRELAPLEVSEVQDNRVDVLLATFTDLNVAAIAYQREVMRQQIEQAAASMYGTFSIKHVFVVCDTGERVEDDDIIFLACEDRYDQLYTKTVSFWTTIGDLYDARFYAKRGTDTYICWAPVIAKLNAAAEAQQGVYAGGILYDSPVLSDPTHRWHDRFLAAVAPQQVTYWPYAQGPFYVLSAELVKDVMELKDQLQPFANEDAMVGGWLLRFRKTMVDLPVAQECNCGRDDVDIYNCYCDTPDFVDRCLRANSS